MTDKEELISLYRIMVDTIIATEQRRQQINSVFLTFFVVGFGTALATTRITDFYVILIAIIVSLIWYEKISYFQKLAKAKFLVIEELESNLSLKPFEIEWKHMKKLQNKNSMIHIRLTDLELWIPFLICTICLFLLFYKIYQSPFPSKILSFLGM